MFRQLQPFEAERRSVQAGRSGNGLEFPCSGPVGHHPPAVIAKRIFAPNTCLSARANSSQPEELGGRQPTRKQPSDRWA
jgi:hypothetical protein